MTGPGEQPADAPAGEVPDDADDATTAELPAAEPAGDADGLADEPAGGEASDTETAEPEPAAPEPAEDLEGPRRRARRERAERRAAEERARAIEQARREAKRRVQGKPADEATRLSRGTVRGLKVLVWFIVLSVVSVGLGLILYFTPLMSARSIVVTGTGAVTREEIVDTARVAPGTPLLQIDTDTVADRVAGIRRVASARVQSRSCWSRIITALASATPSAISWAAPRNSADIFLNIEFSPVMNVVHKSHIATI